VLRRKFRNFRRRQSEDQPAAAHVDAGEGENVVQEGAIGVGIGAVNDRVRASEHELRLFSCLMIRAKTRAGPKICVGTNKKGDDLSTAAPFCPRSVRL